MTDLLKRLESRHINMIAIGGSIGTGIFLASGYAIAIGGPGGALAAYSLMAIVVYFLMTSLGEMSVFKPSSGSFCEYSKLYVGPSFGFAMGYNYWLNWAITIAAEISAAALIVGFWFPHFNHLVFSLVFLSAIVIANIFTVKVYGEIEYLLSFVKVAVIIVFIVLGCLSVFEEPQFGIAHWHIGDAPFHNGGYGFITVFLFAGFAFQGTELIGVASGETRNPEIAIPKSMNLVFWRLTLFYILSMVVISLLLPYTDPRLASQTDVTVSPYTLIFQKYIFHYAADVVNLIILIAVLSAANASMYSATRTLWYMAKKGDAPVWFSRLNRHYVPYAALIATTLVGSVVFFSSVVKNGVLFGYLVQISSLAGFIAWFGIALSHYQFRRHHLPAYGGKSLLGYEARFYPYAQIFAMIVIVFVISAQFIPIIHQAKYTVVDLLVTYSAVIVFLLFYLGHKIYWGIKKYGRRGIIE